MNSIILDKVKRIGARNKSNMIPFDLNSTFKPTIVKDIKAFVDIYEVYQKEYSECRNFRFTITIKPYCTNVLFNVCTEIVKDEGSPNCYSVCDNESAPNIANSSVYGKTSSLKRNYMVANTEYSSPEIGYVYLPGYDIFGNHTLRSLTFRPIMKVASKQINQTRNIFNTVSDLMRTDGGETIKFYPRFYFEEMQNNTKLDMHVYEDSNLLKFIDGSSSQANITVENGWYGFKNASYINSESDKKTPVNNSNFFEGKHIFSHTINNLGGRDFVDMFPDRQRYSFVPIYNEFRQRYEKNWDIFLTYPWKNYYDHNLVRNLKTFNHNAPSIGDGDTYAMATMRVQWVRIPSNRNTLLFRTFCKHNLSANDRVAIYLSKDCGHTYKRLKRTYIVDYVGDLNGNNDDYFFGISAKSLLNDVFESEIESCFYTSDNVIGSAQYTVSNEITEVPVNVSDDIISVYYYENDTGHTNIYDESETFDEMPKTVNALSAPFIRVWNENYIYMVWNNDDERYDAVSEPNISLEYGNWNTFTDTPSAQSKEYIRVKTFDYYRKAMKLCRQKQELLDGIVSISDIINDVFDEEKKQDATWNIRFVKVVNDLDCKYYIRQFRKIPKPNGKTMENETSTYGTEYVDLNFDSETYKLAFSKTLYGDDVVQVTFLDDIVVNHLTDNLGRPITELYCTIVKRNEGYKTWYENMGSSYSALNSENENVEFSRCFGSVTTGFEYLDLDDTFDREDSTRIIKGFMSSATSIYRNDEENENLPMSVEDWDTKKHTKEILKTDSVFFGDVVEYNPAKCSETVLSDACFRFNTAQREIGDGKENGYFDFTYTEIERDDFDEVEPGMLVPFKAVTYKQWLQNDGNEQKDTSNNISVRRREGYFYKPHTKIQIYKFSDNIFQGSHRTLRIKDCQPVQADGILIKIKTAGLHGVDTLNTIYVCDGKDWYPTSVTYIVDGYTFIMKPMDKNEANNNGIPYIDWATMCIKINNGEIKIRVKNEKIPHYANNVGENMFLWRDVINPVDLSDSDACKHPFSNGAFYLDCLTSVYLRRQDPFGINGLFKAEIGEISGTLIPDTDKYKEETEIKCY